MTGNEFVHSGEPGDEQARQNNHQPRDKKLHVPDADRCCPDPVLGEKRGRARRVVHEGPPVHNFHSRAAETFTGRSLLLCEVGPV